MKIKYDQVKSRRTIMLIEGGKKPQKEKDKKSISLEPRNKEIKEQEPQLEISIQPLVRHGESSIRQLP